MTNSARAVFSSTMTSVHIVDQSLYCGERYRNGGFVKEMCSLPLAEDIPITFNSVRKGMRSLDWRDDKPAEMSWLETQASVQSF